MTILAFVEKAGEKRERFDAGYQPSVSVVIAAYNEEKVIARTIEAVLGERLPDLEIIVVDDGSKDDTSGEVMRRFRDRVRLLMQENGGKASALNRGIEHATRRDHHRARCRHDLRARHDRAISSAASPIRSSAPSPAT